MIYELNPVEAITADAVGEPGHRVFYIQARTLDETITLVAEKEQVHLLARGIQKFLSELEEKQKAIPVEEDLPVGPLDLELRGPFEPNFRVAHLDLEYDEDSNLIVLVAIELAINEIDEDEVESDTPESVARFWATGSQMRAMAEHALDVVASGRPICSLCGRPEDQDGHFCPKRNGHSHTLRTP